MRPPSVFVRDLLPDEGNRLKRLSRKAASEAKRERALICWASATKMSAPQIAALVGTDETHVRKVIQAFNERGFSSLDPDSRGGRPRRITAEQRARIIAVAGARPDSMGVPATRWSLRRLARYLRKQQIVQVSPAHLGRILAQAGLSFQRTRTWKASPDPDYEAKAARVLALYATAARERGRGLVRSDGSDQPAPDRGNGLGATQASGTSTRDLHPPARHPLRLRCLRRARRPPPRSDAATAPRQRQPRVPQADPRLLPQARCGSTGSRTTSAPTGRRTSAPTPMPTTSSSCRRRPYASYLNRVECHFLPISEFVVKNADYLNWDAFAFALARHITDRNGAHRDHRLIELERRRQIAA